MRINPATSEPDRRQWFTLTCLAGLVVGALLALVVHDQRSYAPVTTE
jgi:LPS O-antigen subunit length determinant protein (WzzB/FepE family)